ncbi:MAG TPA: hypothetical protein VLI69_00870, partial [Gammaproteobacteria bacterium]|nr:hypothetical protein [Gammaproteobacteria bacterium]
PLPLNALFVWRKGIGEGGQKKHEFYTSHRILTENLRNLLINKENLEIFRQKCQKHRFFAIFDRNILINNEIFSNSR